MKGKFLVVSVLVIVGLGLVFSGRQTQARFDHPVAIDHVFSGINSGQVETALTVFTEDATAENLVRRETYRGADEIRRMLQGMQRNGRRYDVVAIQVNGDTTTARVEVSDRGHVWGTATYEATTQGGKLQSFDLKSFRLELWRIGR